MNRTVIANYLEEYNTYGAISASQDVDVSQYASLLDLNRTVLSPCELTIEISIHSLISYMICEKEFFCLLRDAESLVNCIIGIRKTNGLMTFAHFVAHNEGLRDHVHREAIIIIIIIKNDYREANWKNELNFSNWVFCILIFWQ